MNASLGINHLTLYFTSLVCQTGTTWFILTLSHVNKKMHGDFLGKNRANKQIKMSEEIEKLKKPQKKPIVRYFGDGNKIKTEDAEHIKVNNKKKPIGFSGEVIQVDEQAKFYAKSKFHNKRPEHARKKFHKHKKGLVKLQVDPYARERHARKCFVFLSFGFNEFVFVSIHVAFYRVFRRWRR